ncbi:hypothetical protein [Celeribacter neptunius]|uniref:Uncharacterized protein n=1 Tax=Celeribacter neptunius TaxID=588602 RepID=A0A1I3IP43_9RHOB|nr:hypothetical protein [Celeribacter neptunius]SFI49659.1 hypothetical protein SAMN04487991_0085 [Celeribacter neptunius]
MKSRITGLALGLVAMAGAAPFLSRTDAGESMVIAPVVRPIIRMAEAIVSPDPLREVVDVAPVSAEAPEVVVIRVPVADLARCIETLDQVFLSPIEAAEVQSVSLSPENVGPIVRCEAG